MANDRTRRYEKAVICVLVAAASLAIYAQTLRHDFLNFDDRYYVTENATVQKGLTLDGLRWAFTEFALFNWHPLTWFSHMLDVQLFGMNAGGHHAINVLLHIVNSLLLFHVFERMTQARWRSAAVAALFAAHPLHVESVAWIAERKDLLFTLFWIAAMWAYVRYTERPDLRRYALVAFAFVLGLMSKPMIVTLPFVLLLLDYWPLRRVHEAEVSNAKRFAKLAIEKLPLILLAAVVSALTVYTQRVSGAVVEFQEFPYAVRIQNAVVAYAAYLIKTFVPTGLAVFYPHPGADIALWKIAASAALLITVTAAAISLRRSRPYVPVGWLWYLGTLVPVIGIVQVGDQAMADRYTYITLTGVFIMVVWGIGDLLAARPPLRVPAAIASAVAIVVLATLAAIYAGKWRDSETLFTHALAVTENNFKAHNNLGTALARQGKYEEALSHFRQAVAIRPRSVDSKMNIGAALLALNRPKEAESYLADVARSRPNDPRVHLNLAMALYNQGRYEEALSRAKRALQVDPENRNAADVIQEIEATIQRNR